MPAIVIKCTCSQDFQDAMYGKTMRVANTKFKGEEATCVVCGKLHKIGKAETKVATKTGK